MPADQPVEITRRKLFAILGLSALGVKMARCSPPSSSTPSAVAPQATFTLPAPSPSRQTCLEDALTKRRSVREFTASPLAPEEISQLLWAAQGITHTRGFRTAPSAGALYPLEVLVATAEGLFHYEPQGHKLSAVTHEDVRTGLYGAALHQEPVLHAPAVFVVTAVYGRTETKYGTKRSPRYVHLEAGHAAQNLLLQAVALGLGAVPIGAFYDQEVKRVLGLPADHEPLYLIPVGYPQDADR